MSAVCQKREYMKTQRWIKKNMPSLKGKRVAVTGSTGGIGRELCTHLARLGASLVLLDRNIEKSRVLGKELEKNFCGIEIEYITVDMEDMAAVKRAAELLLENTPDYLVLNAGAYHIPRHKFMERMIGKSH